MALVELYWCIVSKSERPQIGLICWELNFSSFKYNRFYFIFILTLFLMLTKKTPLVFVNLEEFGKQNEWIIIIGP